MANLDQRVQAIGLLALHARLFVGTADRRVVAHRTGASLWSGRKKAFRDGLVNGLKYAAQTPAPFVLERNVEGREVASLRAIEQPARFHGLAQQFLRRERIEQRLEHRTATNVLRAVLRRFASLMVGDAKSVARRVALNQIDGPAQPDVIQYESFVGGAGWVAIGIGRQAEAEFEMG